MLHGPASPFYIHKRTHQHGLACSLSDFCIIMSDFLACLSFRSFEYIQCAIAQLVKV